ncbi:MAG: hypothetical protein P9M08_01630 [Candidatus Erginobacter occultus]|nr:hypothetical protein [Candidatus Erginobacter occultus]
MAKERLSQLQKLILLTAAEEEREWNIAVITYRALVLRIARRCNLIHERSRWMLPRYLASISRSIRNLEKKGIITLQYKSDWEWSRRKSRVVGHFKLTTKGRKFMKTLEAETDWRELPWVKRNLERSRERRQKIREFERKIWGKVELP